MKDRPELRAAAIKMATAKWPNATTGQLTAISHTLLENFQHEMAGEIELDCHLDLVVRANPVKRHSILTPDRRPILTPLDRELASH